MSIAMIKNHRAARATVSIAVSIIKQLCNLGSKYRFGLIVYFAISTYFLIIIYLLWPGFIGWDTGPLVQARIGTYSDWYSVFYTLILRGLYIVFSHINAIIVLHALLTTLLVTLLTIEARRAKARSWWKKILLFSLPVWICLSPVVIGYTNFYSRDILSGLLVANGLFISFIAFVPDKHPFQRSNFLIFIGLSLLFIAALLRKDTFPIFFLVSLFFIYKNFRVRRIVLFCLLLMVAFFAWQLKIRKIISDDPEMMYRWYEVTAFGGTLNSLLHHPNAQASFSQDELEAIDRVIHLQAFSDQWSPHSFAFWHKCCDKIQFSEQDLARFRNIIIKKSLQYPEAFIAGRVATLVAMFGLSSSARYLENLGLSGMPSYSSPHAKERLKYTDIFREPSSSTVVQNLIKYATRPNKNRLLWTMWPQVLLLLVAIFLWSKFPHTALFSAVILSKVFVVFLFAPSSTFSYLYDLYLFGLAIPILMARENLLAHT